MLARSPTACPTSTVEAVSTATVSTVAIRHRTHPSGVARDRAPLLRRLAVPISNVQLHHAIEGRWLSTVSNRSCSHRALCCGTPPRIGSKAFKFLPMAGASHPARDQLRASSPGAPARVLQHSPLVVTCPILQCTSVITSKTLASIAAPLPL